MILLRESGMTQPAIAEAMGLPRSMLHFGADQLRVKILPVKLPVAPWPVEVITLKNRMLSPTANLFISCAREVAKSVARHSPT